MKGGVSVGYHQVKSGASYDPVLFFKNPSTFCHPRFSPVIIRLIIEVYSFDCGSKIFHRLFPVMDELIVTIAPGDAW
jgi:hypothetical protein